METDEQIRQAKQIMLSITESIISELEQQRANLASYQTQLESSWKGDEIQYFSLSLNAAITEINLALNLYYNIKGVLQYSIYY